MKASFIIRNTLYYTTSIALLLLFLAGCQQQPADGQTETANQESENTTREDMGQKPWAFDIEEATVNNNSYREARWTGDYMQMTFMSLKPGEFIDMELHNSIDQFIRIEQGEARVLMGKSQDDLTFDQTVSDDWAIFIPAGYWHELRNTGNSDLKLYSIYAPGEHPFGTRHETYQEAADAHGHDHEHDQEHDHDNGQEN